MKKLKKNQLTPKEEVFIKAYLDTNADTFWNGRKSVQKAYNIRDGHGADSYAYQVLNRERIQRIMEKFCKEDARIGPLIEEGILQRLQNPESRNWQPTADFVAKIRGSFAPEKHEHTHMRPEDRDQKYEEIINKIRGVQGVPALK